jgi:succinate dehydrogenase / fumarate reductase membrane anchor subunit
MGSRFSSGTELKRVRGLGSAREGVSHWTMQRLTAIANALLLIWFVASLLLLPDLAHATVVVWIRQPLVAIPLALLIASSFWHFRLGVQVMIEDYVHSDGLRLLAMLALAFYTVVAGAIALFAVLKIAVGA